MAATPNATIRFEKISETNLKAGIANIAANGLPIDTWWVDTGWYSGKSVPWCDPAHLSSGDYNGDGRLDLKCSSNDGKHIVAFSSGNGNFVPAGWWPSPPGAPGTGWCDPAHLRQNSLTLIHHPR